MGLNSFVHWFSIERMELRQQQQQQQPESKEASPNPMHTRISGIYIYVRIYTLMVH